MAGRKRNHLKRSSENIAKCKRVSRRSAEEKPELDLPTEILELILSRLSSRDKSRSSAVCRKWRDVAKSLEKINQPPVLMYVPRDEDIFHFWNLPYCDTIGTLPMRPSGLVCHAKDGWMLFFDFYNRGMTFFCPHNEKWVKLPRLQFGFNGAAFSAPPSSPSCIVFTMYCYPSLNNVEILTCRPGDTVWTTANCQGIRPFAGCLWNCVVVRNDIFYCLDSTGHIGMYDPGTTDWRILPVEPLKCMKYVGVDDCEKQFFMAEHNGDIFLARTWRVVRPVIYKLDEINNMWIKVKHLEGATFFASSTTSLIRDDLAKPMRNCIYFPKIVYDSERRCVAYSLKQKRYFTESQSFDPGTLESHEGIWVDLDGPIQE